MSKILLLICATVLGLAVSGNAIAQSLFEACAADIDTYCKQVEPGNGRLSACLYAYEDKLSDTCDAAVGEMADIIDVVFERLRYTKQQCGDDIATHCKDAAVGQGRVFSCLYEQKASLSAACVEVIEGVELPEK